MGVFCGVDFGEDNGHQFFVQNSPFGVGQPKLEVLYTKSCPTCISAKKAVQSAQPAIHHNMPGPTKPENTTSKITLIFRDLLTLAPCQFCLCKIGR